LVVVDASLALKWVVNEHRSAEARRLLREWEDANFVLLAPMLFPTECANGLYHRVTKGQVTIAQAMPLLDALLERGVKVIRPSADVLKRSLEMAETLSQPHIYDCQYAATAERLGCEFWSGDRLFCDAAQPSLAFVHWIGERAGIA
jgi:predicted nucleic acid-binding protein